MAVEYTKCMSGVGTLYVAPYGESFPAKTGATLTWAGNWKDIGATKGGVTIEVSTEFFELEADQSLGPIKREISKQTAKVKATMAQSDFDKLKISIPNSSTSTTAAGSGTVGYETLKVDSANSLNVYTLGFECKSPKSPTNTYWWEMWQIWRVTAGGAVSLAYKKGEQTVIDVEFTVEEDSTKTLGEKIFRVDAMNAAAL